MRSFLFLFLFLVIFIRSSIIFSDSDPLTLVDAIKLTLENNTSIKLKKIDISSYSAQIQQAEASFDPQLSFFVSRSRDFTPLNDTNGAFYNNGKLETNRTQYGASYNKKFYSGVSLNNQVSFQRETNNHLTAAAENNTASVNFTLIMPLKKGKDEQVNKASISAAQIEHEAVSKDYLNTVSSIIYNTVSLYWNYVAAHENLMILENSLQKAVSLYTETKKLVDSGEVPAAELLQLSANKSEKEANVIQAKQSLYSAKHQLGRIFNFSLDNIEKIGIPLNTFPKFFDINILDHSFSKTITEKALVKRSDHIAFIDRKHAAEIRLNAAKDSLKRDLNLEVGFGYSGLVEGESVSDYVTPFNHNVPGVNVSAKLNYLWPIDHRSAKASLTNAQAQYDQAILNIQNSKTEISSKVTVAISNLKSSILRLKSIYSSIKYYEKAISSEKKKFKLGMSTLLDVVTIEDRLTSALSQKISAEQALAVALIELRYETGTIGITDTVNNIDEHHLTTLPKL